MEKIIVPEDKQLLPVLADRIATWFPELNKRSVAVSDATITKENIPELPLVMVAFAEESSDDPKDTSKSIINIEDSFMIEFWLKPDRHKRKDGKESPFWAFYDYTGIRNRCLQMLHRYVGPNQERFKYVGMTQDSTHQAVIITLSFIATYQICISDVEDDPCEPSTSKDGNPAIINVLTCLPRSDDCERPQNQEEEDPCQ